MYEILTTTEETVKVSCLDANNVKQVVTIPLSTWLTAKKGIDLGLDAWEILSSYVETKANSAKAISAEAAEAAEKAAKVNTAIDAFNLALSEHVWSTSVETKAIEFESAKAVVNDASTLLMPVLDLNVLRRLDGKLAVNDTLVWSYVSKGTGEGQFWYYQVKAEAPPDHTANLTLIEAKAAFQIACHEETLSLADPILASELKVTAFELDDDGNIIYNAKVKTTRSSGNGTRTRGPWRYTGNVYPEATDKVFNTVADFAIFVGLSNEGDKYPHAPAKRYRENDTLVKVVA